MHNLLSTFLESSKSQPVHSPGYVFACSGWHALLVLLLAGLSPAVSGSPRPLQSSGPTGYIAGQPEDHGQHHLRQGLATDHLCQADAADGVCMLARLAFGALC